MNNGLSPEWVRKEAKKLAREEIEAAFKDMRFALKKNVAALSGAGDYYESEEHAAARHGQQQALESFLECIEAMTKPVASLFVPKVTLTRARYNQKKLEWECGDAITLDVRVLANEHADWGQGGWDIFDEESEAGLGQLVKIAAGKMTSYEINVSDNRYRQIDAKPIVDALMAKGWLK